MARPCRSVLYIPGSRERALEKARDLACDAVIFDLEDAVAPDEKPAARGLLARVLRDADYGPRLRIVRINGLDTPWGQDDAVAMAAAIAGGAKIDAILVPKVNAPADLDAVAALVPGADLWAMMETCAGMLNAAAIAAHPRLTGMVMGTNDLAKELGSRFRPDRLGVQAGLGLCLLAARAHALTIVDGVYNAFKDEAGLRAECEQGRDMGFDGKTLVHPAQLQIANEVFAPSDSDLDLARRQIAAYDAVTAEGGGVAVVDGRIVENLHIVTARALLEKAAAIGALAN
ncbi:HpcH/HpaI aldolase/citrate lyase family protein [Pseudogemmobacter humi]|uniref:(3S)-malyl-CoA thioesterase n=1 Tax=Pseudogemmobacter humi TaxID=2483812 RepID=A0A3P5X3Z8_9RHOB|nr:CoA ester lyase [Pseudogemmobacter humi]VDC25246.1 (3S)-malyl-CoA thioesterase [Pseudogemmobacter humi]